MTAPTGEGETVKEKGWLEKSLEDPEARRVFDEEKAKLAPPTGDALREAAEKVLGWNDHSPTSDLIDTEQRLDVMDALRRALASQPVETEARKILDFYLVDATHDGPFEDPSPEGTVPVAVHELRLLREALRA